MPTRKEQDAVDSTTVAGPRLPSFGAELTVGSPSRRYRSPLSFADPGAAAAAVAPSYQDDDVLHGDASDDDVDAVGDVGDVDDGVEVEVEAVGDGDGDGDGDVETVASTDDDGDVDVDDDADGAGIGSPVLET